MQVDSRRLVQQYKGASQQKFIGFADDRAFEVVTLIPFFPWNSPRKVIWWCPVSELSPAQFEILKSRMEIPNAPNAKPAD